MAACRIAIILLTLGIENFLILDGGLQNWVNCKLPIEKGSNEIKEKTNNVYNLVN